MGNAVEHAARPTGALELAVVITAEQAAVGDGRGAGDRVLRDVVGLGERRRGVAAGNEQPRSRAIMASRWSR